MPSSADASSQFTLSSTGTQECASKNFSVPNFEYTASDRTGSITKGSVEAKDKAAASRALSKDGFFVLEIKKASKVDSKVELPKGPEPAPPPAPSPQKAPASPPPATKQRPSRAIAKSAPAEPKGRLRWPSIQRALYLRQLQVMIGAGIPIYKATSILTESDDYTPQIKHRLKQVPKDLERGRLLSKSLEKSQLFSKLIVSTIKLGEQTGRLDLVLLNLAESEENSVRLKRTLVSRLTYPAVVMVVMSLGLVVLGHVMSHVMSSVPNFSPAQIPIFGVLTSFFQHPAFLPLTLLGTGLFCLGFWKAWQIGSIRLSLEHYLLRMPMVGSLLQRLETNTVTSQLSLLLSAGLSVDRGMGLCAELVWSETFRQALLQGQSELRSGCELGECFQSPGIFPEDVVGLIFAGESAGKLDMSLQKAASYCADQVERTLETALALIEPLMIGFLGIAIGTVLLCTFVPVFNSLQTL